MSLNEVFLQGPGAGGGVVRLGDTIRRPAERTSTGMIAVLEHLQHVAFDGAPRYLGRDDKGRHVFEYLEGDVPLPPHPSWAVDDKLLTSVARLLRRYHDAVGGGSWRSRELGWGHPPDERYTGDLPCHLDASPANTVCRIGRAHALIDFEETALARPLWDVARTVRHWVPLLDPDDLQGCWVTVRGRQVDRLALFVDAYGLGDDDRSELVDAVLANADASHTRMRVEAAAGHPLYAKEWRGGAADRNRRGRNWVATMRPAMITALL